MLQQHDVETAVVEGKRQRAARLERYLPALPRPPSEIDRGFDERFAEVDAGHRATIGRGEKTRWPTHSRPDVEDRHVGRDAGQFGKLGCRGEPTGVELVEASQLLGLQPLLLRP